MREHQGCCGESCERGWLGGLDGELRIGWTHEALNNAKRTFPCNKSTISNYL